MIRFCIWLLERSLVPELASAVVGDLIEQQDRGALWILGETISALWHLHARPRPNAHLLRSFVADLRIDARLLRRSPAFTCVSVLTLGLAIGATTASLLFGIAPNDPVTLVGVCALRAGVTLAACLVPAARAARVSPSAALRSE